LEPITMARKPFPGTVAANVLAHGTGALNVDGCRVAHDEDCRMMAPSQANIDNPSEKHRQAGRREFVLELKPGGRWPANLILTYPEDEYKLKDNITPQQLAQLAEWMNENA
jgi:site-specific DNA-methyltransferase (adenine-specific)